MNEEDLEFCKECGMEFPDGLEDECPLCGNELFLEESENLEDVVGTPLDDSQKCAECGQWYDQSDEWFWDYWTEFDGPEWLSLDDVWCTKCILKRFEKENPDFKATGLEPDTFVIWQQALDEGIDLTPKLFDIEFSNSIRRLQFTDREQIIAWLDSDCPIDEAEEWIEQFDEVHDALEWREAGFRPHEVEDWMEWGCTPDEAAEAKADGDGYPPRIDFKKFGFNLADAALLERENFSTSDYEGSECFIGTWIPSELSLPEMVNLRRQLNSMEEIFETLHHESQQRLKSNERTYEFWDALAQQFKELKMIGLQINIANLEKYWGLKSNEILKVIDAGGTAGIAATVIRHGGSTGNIKMVERLIDIGLGQATATFLAQRGLLAKHIKELEKGGNIVSSLGWLSSVLAVDNNMKVSEALDWIETEARLSEIKGWREYGFGPQNAARWSNEGFHPELARKWTNSGVDSPIVAKRRRDAGLTP